MKADGTIDKYKARLTIKGFRQQKGLYYVDTYSTRITLIKMILAIAALRNWEVHQMNVKMTFLNGDLEKVLYMNQPEGFMALGLESKVYRLVKSLYGLRKAPKQGHKFSPYHVESTLPLDWLHIERKGIGYIKKDKNKAKMDKSEHEIGRVQEIKAEGRINKIDVPINSSLVLVRDKVEVPDKEEEFEEEEEEPREEEDDDMEVDIEEDENDPELTYPYEEVDPLNPLPPASESQPENVNEVEDTVESEDETVPASVHEVGESSTAPFLQEDSDGLLPGLMRRDVNSLFGRMASLSRRLCGREMAHAMVKNKGKEKDEYYGKLILDLGNEVRSSMEQGTAAMEKVIEKLGNAD
ncbi:putative reverse transcriptase domain-containing protein, partial [Tanacetum coccineum]